MCTRIAFFAAVRIARGKGSENRLVLVERLFGHPGVKHQAEDMEVGMLVRQRLANELIAGELQDLVVEDRVLTGESRIAQPLVFSLPAGP